MIKLWQIITKNELKSLKTIAAEKRITNMGIEF